MSAKQITGRADDDFAYLTMQEAAKLLRTRQVSSLELTNAALERIERLNPSLNAFITVTADIARKQARDADKCFRAGEHRGPLHGMPVTIKDNFMTNTVRTTAGSRILADFVPVKNSDAGAWLISAGAVLLGKTNMNEFAYGIHGMNPHYGDVHNPWDLERTTGGSSSGSAAAVAAGIGFGSMGTDTGGSLRIPASFCGVCAFKPTYGQISMHGIIPLAASLDHAGPLARCVDDLFAMFIGAHGPVARKARGKTGKRKRRKLQVIGWPRNYFFERVDPQVHGAIEAAVKLLQAEGFRVEEVALPNIEQAMEAATTIALVEAAMYHAKMQYFPERAADYSEDVRARLALGCAVKAVDYLNADAARQLLVKDFERAFESVDVIVAPATTTTAPRIGETEVEIGGEKIPLRTAVVNANRPANFTGHPAIAVPCGFSREGLPMGMQFMGEKFEEPTLFGIAYEYEQATEWHKRHPGL